jgi:hypothetical protein
LPPSFGKHGHRLSSTQTPDGCSNRDEVPGIALEQDDIDRAQKPPQEWMLRQRLLRQKDQGSGTRDPNDNRIKVAEVVGRHDERP